MSDRAIILWTLIVYQLALIAIGIFCRKRTSTGEEYFLGGRGLGPAVAALSASASSSSAWTLLGVSGLAFSKGLAAIWLFPACVGGFALNWLFVAPRLGRRARVEKWLTLTDALAGTDEGKGDKGVRWLASIIVLLAVGLYVASQYIAAGKTFHSQFGLGPDTSIVIGMGIVLVYTICGGFWAVSLTDTLQGLLMVAAALVMPVAALVHVGGLAAMVDGLRREGVADVLGGLPVVAGIGMIAGLLGIGLGYPGQPHVVNRFMALREGDDAVRTGRAIALAWAVVVYAGMLLVGWCVRAGFPDVAQAYHMSRLDTAAAFDAEIVFFTAAERLFNPIATGLIVAGVLSALMSTADSQLLVAASSVVHDVAEEEPKEDRLVRRSRWTVLILGGASIGLAFAGTREIFAKVLSAWSVMGAAFGPLLVLRLVGWRVSPGRRRLMILGGALTSLVLGHADLGTWSGFGRDVVPYVVAFALGTVGCR